MKVQAENVGSQEVKIYLVLLF